MTIYTILPGAKTLKIDRMIASAQGFEIHVGNASRQGICTKCHRRSHRIHSYYTRIISDLSWQNQKTSLHTQVRKFFLR